MLGGGSPRVADRVITFICAGSLVSSSYAVDKALCFSSSESNLISRARRWLLRLSLRGSNCSSTLALDMLSRPLRLLMKRIAMFCTFSMASMRCLEEGSHTQSA